MLCRVSAVNVFSLSLPSQLANAYKKGYCLPAIECPQRVYDLVRKCWALDKEKRPGFTELERMVEDLMHSSPATTSSPSAP